MPFRSAPADAAVGVLLAILSVRVDEQVTCDGGRPKKSATTPRTFVYRPWPISVPPWAMRTLPSV